MSNIEEKLYEKLNKEKIEITEEMLYYIIQFYNAAKISEYQQLTDEQIVNKIFNLVLKSKEKRNQNEN